MKSDLEGFQATIAESDIFILAKQNLKVQAENAIRKYRLCIEEYIKQNPAFGTSLKPISVQGEDFDSLPDIIKKMLVSSQKTRVGPMAGVAGAVAEFVGRELLEFSTEIIVENGGDIFIKTSTDRELGIYAGNSPLSGKIAILVKSEETPLGVCTSSGTVGHSLSFGKADAVTVIARDTTLSDAAATAICNTVKTKNDIEKALNFSKTIEGIMGCVIIYSDRVGTVGEIELV